MVRILEFERKKYNPLNFANILVALSLLSTIDKQTGLVDIDSEILDKLENIEHPSIELLT